ncbi:MAG: hypothetical protein AAGM22_10125 [Acidobacteriota bacterium]
MSESATASAQASTTDSPAAESPDADSPAAQGVNAILPPGQSSTVFFGEEPASFEVRLTGTIQREAELAVAVNDANAAVLDFTSRSTVVNGRSIVVSNIGRVQQGFQARQL